MPEPILVSKLLDLRATALVKSTSSTLKGLLVIGAIAGLGWCVWVGLIQPHTKYRVASTNQSAEQITNVTNNYPEKKSLIDLKVWFIKVKLW